MIQDITAFIVKQTVATICCVDSNGAPYCFNCVFAFDEEKKFLYFKSSEDTYHAQIFKENKTLAGTVLPDKLKMLVVQGVQFSGELMETKAPETIDASKKYHKKYPLALAKSGVVWTVQLNALKMTDSSKGFGTKLQWKREIVASMDEVPS